MLRAAALVAILLVMPTVSAFPGGSREVDISYDAESGPLAMMAGRLTLDAQFAQAFLASDLHGARTGVIPTLIIADAENETAERHDDVTLEITGGTLLITFDGNGSVAARSRVPYALAVHLADAPFGEGPSGPGMVLAAREANVTLTQAGDSQWTPLDAYVRIVDLAGDPIAGWEGRRVNVDANLEHAVSFRAEGAFQALIGASVLGGASGSAGSIALTVSKADVADFDGAVAALGRLKLGGDTENEGGFAGGLDALAPLSDILNGGALLMNTARDGRTPTPRHASFDGETVELGGFALLRGDGVRLETIDGSTRLSGVAVLAMSASGVAVDAPSALGPIPIISVLFWLAAVAAVVVFFVRRPPKMEKRIWSLRLGALALYGVVFLLAFWWWDGLFAESFGTSFLQAVRAPGAFDDPLSLGAVLSMQLVPWGFAAFFFALPVRIVLGVALRYAGKGTNLKSVAKAGGIVALMIFGPAYALWALDLVITRVAATMT